tara:strand:- start:131 stop:334 length:204 start_codon:yes stop_codon:yes gene_type:complete
MKFHYGNWKCYYSQWNQGSLSRNLLVDEELPETDDTFWPDQAEGISSDLLDRINMEHQEIIKQNETK